MIGISFSKTEMTVEYDQEKCMELVLASLRFIPLTIVLLIGLIVNTLMSSSAVTNHEKSTSYSVNLPVDVNKFLETVVVPLEKRLQWCQANYECRVLGEAGYHETRNQHEIGVAAMMSVVKNRIEDDGLFVNQRNIPAVVYAKAQFSYVDDGSRARGMREYSQKERMYIYAYDIIHDDIADVTNGALYYHTIGVNPWWNKHYEYVATIDDHHFYK